MRKLMTFLVVGILAIVVAGCGGSGRESSNSPASIEKAMYSQFKSGNYEKGVTIFFDNLASDNEMKKEEIQAFAEKIKQGLEAQGGIANFEIIEETIDESGETATVRTKIIYGDGEEDENYTNYVKVDGKWKIFMGK